MKSSELLGKWRANMSNDALQRLEKPVPVSDRPPEPSTSIPAAIPGGIEWRKKSILIVDSNARSRETRAKGMRAQGVHVDCVASTDAARMRLATETYNLILVDPGHNVGPAESLVKEIRTKNSRQLVRFLVGSPLFIVRSLSANKT